MKNVDLDEEDFANRLKALIGKENLYAFASRCGISRGSMKTFVDKGTPLTGKNLIRLKRATGASMDWLLGGEGTMYSRHLLKPVLGVRDEAKLPYLANRQPASPIWVAPVWAAYRRLIKPDHVRKGQTGMYACQVLATDFPELNLSSEELEQLLAILNKMADDLPEEVPVTPVMVRNWLWQLEEQGTKMATEGADGGVGAEAE